MIPPIILLKKKFKLIRLFRRNKLSYVALAFLLSVLINGVLFYFAEGILGGREGLTLWRSLYWAVITMATVGYGDVIPQTLWGTVVTIETVIVGIAIFTMLVSVLAEGFMNASLKKSMGLGKLKKVDVLVIGNEESCIEAIHELQINLPYSNIAWLLPQPPRQPPQDIDFVAGDPTDEGVLRRASAHKAGKIIVCMKDDSKAVHTVLMIRKINKEAEIITLAKTDKARELLKEAGSTRVVSARMLGRVLASSIFEPSVTDFINEVTTARGVADLVEYLAGEDEHGITVEEAERRLRDKVGVKSLRIVALVRNGEMIIAPPTHETISSGDKLVIVKAKDK